MGKYQYIIFRFTDDSLADYADIKMTLHLALVEKHGYESRILKARLKVRQTDSPHGVMTILSLIPLMLLMALSFIKGAK